MRNFIEVVTRMALNTQDDWLRNYLNSIIDCCGMGFYSSEMMWWIFGSRVFSGLKKYAVDHGKACLSEQWFLNVLSYYSEIEPAVIQQRLGDYLRARQ